MKRMKKILALLLAVVMVMSMGMSVLADTTYTITITNKDNSGVHTYEAYQIFVGDLSETTGGYVLSNIKWGTGVNASDLVSALNTASNDSSSKLSGLFPSTTVSYDTSDPNASAVKIAEILAANKNSEGFAEAFAAIVAEHLSSTATETSTYSSGTYTISGLAAGYYFVKDQDNSLSGQTDTAYTSYILEVVANVNIEGKEEAPTLSKSASTETAAIGDTITYTLTSKVPDVTGYSSYTFTVTDTLSAGQTFNNDVKVTIKGDEVANTSNANYTVTTSTASGVTTITITFNQFLNTIASYAEDDAIVITYSAELDGDYDNDGDTDTNDTGDDAFTNNATLTYSNDPNASTESTTVEVETKVYTTSLILTKTYGSNATVDTSVLSQTGFSLYMKLDSSTGATYAMVDGELVSVSSLTGQETVTAYYKQIGSETNPSGSAGTYTISFVGLDAGDYLLVETSVPTGYNKAADVTFTAGLDSSNKWTSTSTVVTVDSDGNYITAINNSMGSNLPVTGGIGTTIFYVVGAVLVLGAAVILITRRRMASR